MAYIYAVAGENSGFRFLSHPREGLFFYWLALGGGRERLFSPSFFLSLSLSPARSSPPCIITHPHARDRQLSGPHSPHGIFSAMARDRERVAAAAIPGIEPFINVHNSCTLLSKEIKCRAPSAHFSARERERERRVAVACRRAEEQCYRRTQRV